MDPQRTVYVTYLDKEGPYIKIWGQTDRNLPIAIEKTLQQITPQFEQGLHVPAPAGLQASLMCCAKFKDGNYYRAKVTNTSYCNQGLIEVLFVDYGNKDIIPCANIRVPHDSMQLLSIPAQSKDFILAEVAMPLWDLETFEAIASELRYLEFEIVPICEIRPFVLIRLLSHKQNVTFNLINRRLVIEVSIQSQQQALQQYLQTVGGAPPEYPQPTPAGPVSVRMASPPSPVTPSTPTLLSYKVMPLDNGSEHDVYVSYVSDGPCLFSVQLQKLEGLLKRLMAEINSIDLLPLDEYPLPGTVCLAQSSEDGYICRAVVTSMVDGKYKVFYVDFGNTEVLQFDKLFQIPFKYVIPKVMATRFALSGLETANVSIEMKCAFKDFVNNKLLRMQVKPAAAKSALPLCDLWDESGTKAIDVARQGALVSYPAPVALARGCSHNVKVSYVCSCNKFYVQLKNKERELADLMNVLSYTCEDRPQLHEENMRPGAPCYALYTDDVWYRAQIVHSSMQGIKVKYVDYGNEELMPVENVREPISDHIFMLRPQAIECCLNGYQNIEPDTQRDSLLEELITEQEFYMKVVEMQPDRALVELFNSAHYNVASLLLERIASVTLQASPLLIQDNHRIEHRKRSPPQNFKDKQPLRELNERNTETNNWRQNPSRSKSKPHIERYKRNSGGYNNNNNYNNNHKNRNHQWDGHESSDSRESSNSQRDRGTNSFNARTSGQERNMYQRGPKRLDAPRKRIERSEENSDTAGGELNKYGTNTENRTFGKRERRNTDQNQDNFQQNRISDRCQRQPRGPPFQRNNEDRPKRFNKNFDSSRDNDHSKKFNGRNQNFQRDDNPGKRFNRGHDDQSKKFNSRYEDKSSGDGYRNKRNEFKKEPSEKSFSDASEKSWKKGPRPRQTDGKGKGKTFKRSPTSSEVMISLNSFGNVSKEDDEWNVGGSQPTITAASPDPEESTAAPTDCFKVMDDLLNQTEPVSMSWFYNPQYFYVQLEKYRTEFRRMMEEIQTRYKKRQTITPTVGQPVIALFPEDKVLYRAQVLNCNLNKFQVRYIDYGNTATVDKIYGIETKYMKLPIQAIYCSLDGIVPPTEAWLDADSYSNYFYNDSFTCTFTSTFGANMYYVDLLSEGSSITEKLVTGHLAVRYQADLDINMLLGQQLMVLLKEVRSLSNIRVEIEPNLGVDATMHNLADAAETFEDDLKAWTGNFVIMYVDSVIENRIEVTFYDTTGQKLKVLVPDEGAYDSVDPLSPLPIYTKSIYGFVCHAIPASIFLQPSKYESIVNQLVDAMFERYNQTTEADEKLVPEIDGIYAVCSSDTNWYRGKVTEISEEGAAGDIEVSYLDYGNSETVKAGELRPLADEFFQTHALAVEIRLEGGDCEKYNNLEVLVEIRCEDDGWVGKIVDENREDAVDEVSENHLETNGIQVEEEQTKSDVSYQNETVENQPIAETGAEQTSSTTVAETQLPQQGVNVILSHSDSPSEFYLQLSDDLESIEGLLAELQLQVPNLTNLENPTPGILCAAPFSVDGQWYRAQILDADDDITTVRFVDYGNTDVIDNRTTSIKTLPAEMLTMEYHARLCSLYVKPATAEWSTSALEKYEQFLDGKSLRTEIVHQDEKTTYVELYANGENVAERLKNENLAIDLQLETEAGSTGFISHLNSPSEFWMQLESSVPDLEWVAEQLSTASSFPTLQDLTPGSLCAAVFPEDESWYRARILSNTVAGIEVIFIDYGNSFFSTELRELPEDLIMLPPLAMKCSLQKPTGILQWSSKATEKFNEISADGATVFNVNILTTGETSVAQLTIDSDDVSYQLLPELKDCRISHFSTLDEFWVQLVENDPKLEEIQNKLASLTSLPDIENPEINDIVAAIYESNWCRARILSKINEGFNVLYIDYGNEAAVTNGFKKVTDDCDNVDALAKRYKLEVLPRTRWAEDSIDKFYEINEEGTVFQLESVSENVARLYLNGEDIRIILGTVKFSPISSAQTSPRKMPSQEVKNDAMSPKESEQNIKTLAKEREISPSKSIKKGKEEQSQLQPARPHTEGDDAIITSEDKLEIFKEISLHLNQTISDTSQPELDEDTSLDTSGDGNVSEGERASESPNSNGVPKGELIPETKTIDTAEVNNLEQPKTPEKLISDNELVPETKTIDTAEADNLEKVKTPEKLTSDNELVPETKTIDTAEANNLEKVKTSEMLISDNELVAETKTIDTAEADNTEKVKTPEMLISDNAVHSLKK